MKTDSDKESISIPVNKNDFDIMLEHIENQKKDMYELRREINEKDNIIKRLSRDKESVIQQLKMNAHNIDIKVQKLLSKRSVQLEEKYSERNRELNYKINKKQAELDEEIKKTKIQMKRYTEEHQQKLQKNSSDFVKYTVDDLVSRENKLSKISSMWSCAGAAVLFVGLVVTIVISIKNFSSTSEVITWPYLVYFSFKGIIVLTIIGLFTRYNFINSGNYMQEAIKLANQIHKIRFGQFYIETYGATATWEEAKEAFANWNGDEKSNWEKNIQYDEFNNGLSMLSSAIDKIKTVIPSGKEKSKEDKEIKSEKI